MIFLFWFLCDVFFTSHFPCYVNCVFFSVNVIHHVIFGIISYAYFEQHISRLMVDNINNDVGRIIMKNVHKRVVLS